MLAPRDRSLFSEALRPPIGYRFDQAVGTTFSLDLISLLSATIGFTAFDLQDSEGVELGARDELLLLRVLREHAENISVFCQAGRIAAPSARQHLLLAMLEKSVVEARAPRTGGIFHPKVWAIRYLCSGESTKYRLLVSSRNLTFSRCWDTMLVLDGTLRDRKIGYSKNRPLGDFFASLPNMAVAGCLPPVAARASLFAEELRRVEFEHPEGIEEVDFHPMGIEGFGALKVDSFDRQLVVSPFLDTTRVAELGDRRRGDILISDQRSLDGIAAQALSNWKKVYAFSSEADLARDSTAGKHDGDADADVSVSHSNLVALDLLQGLHAKLYIVDKGARTRVFTGSANCTGAAFNKNVEFLAELQGNRKRIGIDAFMESGGDEVQFSQLISEYQPSELPEDADTEVQLQLEQQLDRIRHAIGGIGWVARAIPVEQRFTLYLAAKQDLDPDTINIVESASIRPVSFSPSYERAVELRRQPFQATFEDVRLEAIAAFFVCRVRTSIGSLSAECSFVVRADLQDVPAEREEALLRSMLGDRNRFMQFLFLLLADDPGLHLEGHGASPSFQPVGGGSAAGYMLDGEPLLEALLRALHRDPSRIDQLRRLINDMNASSADEKEQYLPDEFSRVFNAVWSAREAMR